MKQLVSLKANSLFGRVFKKGKRTYWRGFVLHYCPNGLAVNRLGIHIGKKTGCAVRRNRIRRLLRESFRHQAGHMRIGYDLVVTVRAGSDGVDKQSAADECVTRMLRFARLLPPEPKAPVTQKAHK